MFEKYVNPLEHPEDVRLARRQALMVLAALPAGMLTGFASSHRGTVPSTEELLPSCLTSITACWHLMAGRDFATVEHTLSQYFPLLVTWTHQSSTNQRTAAYLAAQGYLLFGLVSLHQLSAPRNFQRRFFYCQRAVECAQEAGDPALLAAALIHLGGAAGDLGQPSQMLHFHQQAMSGAQDVSLLLQSKIHAEIAYAYAKNGQVQEALYHIARARELFPGEAVQGEPGFLSTDYGLFSLVLFEGQTLLDAGRYGSDMGQSKRYYEQAQTALDQIEHAPPTIIFPERFRVEIINQQTLADIKAGDLEHFRVHLIEGARGAKVLRSEKRQQEVLANWKEARKVWPHEALVTELADLLLE